MLLFQPPNAKAHLSGDLTLPTCQQFFNRKCNRSPLDAYLLQKVSVKNWNTFAFWVRNVSLVKHHQIEKGFLIAIECLIPDS